MRRSSIVLQPAEARVLEQWARGSGRIAERSEIILLSSGGRSAESVAAKLGLAVPTVYKWRKRFRDKRLDGLQDLPRPGQPRRLSETRRQEILRWTTDRLAPRGHWTIRSLAAAMEITEHQVREVWAAHDLKPHALRAVRLLEHPALAGRSVRPAALYVGPPHCALLLDVREHSAEHPPAPSHRGSSERQDSDSSIYTAYRVASLTDAQLRQRDAERCEERDGLLRAACRRHQGHTLHLVLSTAGLEERLHRQIAATLRAPLTCHSLVTNEAWLHAVNRWLQSEHTEGGWLYRDLRTSLAQHAQHRPALAGATFAWIADEPAPPRPRAPAPDATVASPHAAVL